MQRRKHMHTSDANIRITSDAAPSVSDGSSLNHLLSPARRSPLAQVPYSLRRFLATNPEVALAGVEGSSFSDYQNPAGAIAAAAARMSGPGGGIAAQRMTSLQDELEVQFQIGNR